MHDVVAMLPLEDTPAKRARGPNAHSPALPQQQSAAQRAAQAAQARVDGSSWSLTKELFELGKFKSRLSSKSLHADSCAVC